METLSTSTRRVIFVGAVAWSFLLVVGLVAVVIARVSGLGLDVVATNSMEPAIETGSLAVIQPVPPQSVEVGDVIRFVNHADKPVLHRVVEIIEHNGVRRFRTKGDANPAPDTQLVHENRMSGRLGSIVPAALVPIDPASPRGFWLGIVVVAPVAVVGFGRRRASEIDAEPALVPAWLDASVGVPV